MLCELKHSSIVQWHNCLTKLGSNISSLTELKDGDILQRHIKEMFLESQEKVVIPAGYKSINFIKEADSRASFEFVKRYINETYHIISEELVSYEDCMSGNKLELAKVSVFILSSTVTQLLLKPDDNRLGLLKQLDGSVQQEIVECMTFIMDHREVELRRVEFNRILSRSAKIKERSMRFSSTPAKSATPRSRGRPKKFADYEIGFGPATPSTSNVEDSPSVLMQMLESPKVKVWSTISVKEREIRTLRAELDLAERKIIDQRCIIEDLRNEMNKKKDENDQLKERYQMLQEELDARNQSMEVEAIMPDMNQTRVAEMHETEISSLKEEVESFKVTCDELKSKLDHYREKDAALQEQLKESQLHLQVAQLEKESLTTVVEKLQDELKDLKEMISVYKDKLQEKEKEYDLSKLMESSPEILGDIIEEDYRVMKEKLLNEELQNAHLRKLLEEKEDLCKKQQEILKNHGTVPVRHDAGTSHTATEPMCTEEGVEKDPPAGSWSPHDPRDNGGESVEPDRDTRSVCNEWEGGMAVMNEIMLLAMQVFATHGERQTPDFPAEQEQEGGAASFEEVADRVKQLLREMLAGQSSTSSSVKNETKSEETSLDSGVNLCGSVSRPSAPGTEVRTEREAEPPDDPYRAQCEKLAEENESLRSTYQEILKVKNEYARKTEEHFKSVRELTDKMRVATNKLAKCERNLIETASEKKHYMKKYSLLKEYVVNTEKELKSLRDSFKEYKTETESKLEQLAVSENLVKKLQASVEHYRDSRNDLSKRVDFLQHRCDSLEDKLEKLLVELDTEKANCKELKLQNKHLRTVLEWADEQNTQTSEPPKNKIVIGVETRGNCAEGAGPYVRLNAVISNKGDESILSGNHFNKSMHGALVTEDEESYLNHSALPRSRRSFPPRSPHDLSTDSLRLDEEYRLSRLKELRNRNSLYIPHLRSHYLLETQGLLEEVDPMGEDEDEEDEERPRKKRKKGKKKDDPQPSTSSAEEVPPSKKLSGIFKTPKGLHRLVQMREEEKRRACGIRRPRFKL